MSIDAPSAITIPASLQAQVHAMIQAIGGYWRPVNAVARLLEELAELGEELTTADADGGREKLSGEFADVDHHRLPGEPVRPDAGPTICAEAAEPAPTRAQDRFLRLVEEGQAGSPGWCGLLQRPRIPARLTASPPSPLPSSRFTEPCGCSPYPTASSWTPQSSPRSRPQPNETAVGSRSATTRAPPIRCTRSSRSCPSAQEPLQPDSAPPLGRSDLGRAHDRGAQRGPDDPVPDLLR